MKKINLSSILNPSRVMNYPNIHSAILAVIIIVMFFALMNPELCQYESIVRHRREVSDMVGTSAVNENDLMSGHEQCIHELEALEESSRLGEFLVKCDKTTGGKIINYFALYGTRWVLIYLVIHILIQVVRGVYHIMRKVNKNKAAKEPRNQSAVHSG